MIKIILMLIMFANCSPEKMIKYSGENYEILYPESWLKQEKQNVTLFLSPKKDEKDLFQENINIMLQDLSQKQMTLEEYTELTKKQIVDNLGASSIISLKDTELAGQQAKEFIFDMDYQGKHLKLKQYWFIKDDIAYIFSYTASPSEFEAYENIATKMITSFKFI